MAIFEQNLPEWLSPGTKPVDDVIQSGWKVKDKPPAAWFNWAWYQTYMCLKEVREYIEDEKANKSSSSLEVATASGSSYIVTSALPATELVNGMAMNVIASGSSLVNMTLNLDGLGAKALIANGSKLQKMAMLNGRVYSLVYSTAADSGNGGWVVTNLINKTEFPPTYASDLDQIDYSFYCVTTSATTKIPDSKVANDRFFITVVVDTQTGFIYQMAKSLVTFEEYNRTLSGGVVQKDWQLSLGDRGLNLVRNESLFNSGMGEGMTISFNSTAPYNVSVSSGYLYVASFGLVEKRVAQANIAMPSTTDGTYNIWTDRGGICQIIKSTEATPASCIYRIGSVTLASSIMSGLERNIAPAAIIDKAIIANMNVQTLSADKTLVFGVDKPFQWLNPNGANRNIALPTIGISAGAMFYVYNTGAYVPNSGGYYLAVKQATSTKGRVFPQHCNVFIFDGANWSVIAEHTTYLDKALGKSLVGYDEDVLYSSDGMSVFFGLLPVAVESQAYPSFGGGSTTEAKIAARSTEDNVDLNLVSKGSGKVKANGAEIATTSSAQVLSNKSIIENVNIETLSGNKTITFGTDKPVQWLTPSGANRDVVLATSGVPAGAAFFVRNNASSGSYRIIIKQASTIKMALSAGDCGSLLFDGTNWLFGEYTRNSMGYFLDVIYANDGSVLSSPDAGTTYLACALASVAGQAFPRVGGSSATEAVISADSPSESMASLNLVSKGTGKVKANGYAIRTKVDDYDNVNATSDTTITFANASLVQRITSNSHMRVITLSTTNVPAGARFIIKNVGDMYLFMLKSDSTTIRSKVYPGDTLSCIFVSGTWEVEGELVLPYKLLQSPTLEDDTILGAEGDIVIMTLPTGPGYAYLYLGGSGQNTSVVQAAGVQSNIDLNLLPKGTGKATAAGNPILLARLSPITIASSETLAIVRERQRILANSSGTITLTVPLNSAVPFPIGTEIEVVRYGTGAVTFAFTGGVSILSADSKLSISTRYASASLVKTATDTWLLIGALS